MFLLSWKQPAIGVWARPKRRGLGKGARQELHGVAAWGCWPRCRWPLAGVLDEAQLHHNTAAGADGSPAQRLLLAQRATTKSDVGEARRRCERGVPMRRGELDGGGGRRRTATCRGKQCANMRSHDHRSAMCSPWERCPGDWGRGGKRRAHQRRSCRRNDGVAARTPPCSDERAMTAAAVQGRRPWHKHWNGELLRDGCALRGPRLSISRSDGCQSVTSWACCRFPRPGRVLMDESGCGERGEYDMQALSNCTIENPERRWVFSD